MRQVVRNDLHRRTVPISFIRREEPGLAQLRQRAAQGSANVRQIEIRVGIMTLAGIRCEVSPSNLVLQRESSQSRVFVVVESGTVVTRASALSGNSDV